MRHTTTLCLCATVLLATIDPLGAQEITVRPDDPRASYALGEEAGFVVESDRRGELSYVVRHSLRTDPIAEGALRHDGPSTVIPFRYDSAAFITVEARIDGDGYGVAGASFGRADIGAFGEEPGDFDAFWASERAALDAVPLDLRVDLEETRPESDVYSFSAAQLDGRRVYGYLVVPAGASAATPVPASLQLPPFGESPGLASPDVSVAEEVGCIAVSISIHDAPTDQADPEAYEPDDPTTRSGVYYRYAVAAARRAIDVIAARADWNGEDLAVYGDSQGGGLSFLTAAADERVTVLMESIAALAQHGGYLRDRPSGFPYYLNTAAATGDDLADVYEAVSYYDAAFAARRFAGPSLHFVNYLDDICPPATVYAAHNELTGARVTLHSLRLGHSNPEEYWATRFSFLRSQFAAASGVAAHAASPAPLEGHYVDAGPDRAASVGEEVPLVPTYGLDGADGGDDDWTGSWELVEGPADVDFASANAANTTATFAAAGTYRLRLRVVDPYTEQPDKWWELVDDLVVEVGASSGLFDGNRPPSALEVQPNPASSEVQLKVPEVRIVRVEVRDLLGRPVQLPFRDRRLDVSRLSPGRYVALAYTDDGQRHAAPLVVQR